MPASRGGEDRQTAPEVNYVAACFGYGSGQLYCLSAVAGDNAGLVYSVPALLSDAISS